MELVKTYIPDTREYPSYEIVIEYMHGDADGETFDTYTIKEEDIEKVVTFCNKLLEHDQMDVDYDSIPYYDEFQCYSMIPGDHTCEDYKAMLYKYDIYFYDKKKDKYSVEIKL